MLEQIVVRWNRLRRPNNCLNPILLIDKGGLTRISEPKSSARIYLNRASEFFPSFESGETDPPGSGDPPPAPQRCRNADRVFPADSADNDKVLGYNT